MKNTALSLISLLLVTILGSYQTANAQDEPAAEDAESIKQIIHEKNQQLMRLYREGKIDSAATYFADDVIQMPPNQPALHGIENYKQAWKELVQFGEWDFDFIVQDVRHSGDLAVELGKYTLDFQPNQDAPMPAMSDQGNYVVLWEKTDGDWKIVWDAPVSEMPLPSVSASAESEDTSQSADH